VLCVVCHVEVLCVRGVCVCVVVRYGIVLEGGYKKVMEVCGVKTGGWKKRSSAFKITLL
jgi:hypothetical protein